MYSMNNKTRLEVIITKERKSTYSRGVHSTAAGGIKTITSALSRGLLSTLISCCSSYRTRDSGTWGAREKREMSLINAT